MKKIIIALVLAAMPPLCTAAESKVPLDSVYVNLNDKASLQRGARLFVNFCLSCHSASFMRYNRMANDLDISEDLLKENLMFASGKTGALMTTTMPADDAKKWFGVAPPDLTVVARVRKPEWIYTYLRSFYLDEASPSGWNNTLFENVAMPHILYELQGSQRAVFKEENGVTEFDRFELQEPGTMTPAEYDNAMRDLTNFLVYLGEPAKLKRYTIGVFVILFLIMLTVLSYLLKKEYWKDIH
jgi:ubiquinol-cytochrome c reductase cytochrome c1 subunit